MPRESRVGRKNAKSMNCNCRVRKKLGTPKDKKITKIKGAVRLLDWA